MDSGLKGSLLCSERSTSFKLLFSIVASVAFHTILIGGVLWPAHWLWSTASPTVVEVALIPAARAVSAPKAAVKKWLFPKQAKAATQSKPLPENVEPTPQPETEGAEGDPGVVDMQSGSLSRAPRVVREERAVYPQTARANGIQGAVKLRLVIDTLGKPTQIELVDGPGHGLNEAAIAALQAFLFSPGYVHSDVVGERPVPVRITYIYHFRIE